MTGTMTTAKCGGVEHEWMVLVPPKGRRTNRGNHYASTMYCVWCLDVRILAYDRYEDEPGIKNRMDFK